MPWVYKSYVVIVNGKKVTRQRRVWQAPAKPKKKAGQNQKAAKAAAAARRRKAALQAAARRRAQAEVARRRAAASLAQKKKANAERDARRKAEKLRQQNLALARRRAYEALKKKQQDIIEKSGLWRNVLNKEAKQAKAPAIVRPTQILQGRKTPQQQRAEAASKARANVTATAARSAARDRQDTVNRYGEYWHKQQALNNFKAGDSRSARGLEVVLRAQLDKALKNGTADSGYTTEVQKRYEQHAQKVYSDFEALTAKLTAALDKGDEKAARTLYKKYLAAQVEFIRLFGKGDTPLAEGAYNEFYKQYDEIGLAQREWWKKQMKAALQPKLDQMRKVARFKPGIANTEAYKILQEQNDFLNGRNMPRVVDHYERTVVNGKETKKPVYRDATTEEALQIQYARIKVAQEQAIGARLKADAAAKQDAIRHGKTNYKGQWVKREHLPIIEALERRQQAGLDVRAGTPEQQQLLAKELLADWERAHPKPTNKRDSHAMREWEARRKAYEEDVYGAIGGNVPHVLEQLIQFPGVSHALSLLQAGNSAIGAGGRVVAKVVSGSSVIELTIPIDQLPPEIRAKVEQTAGNIAEPIGYGLLRGRGVVNDTLSQWLETPEGKAWYAAHKVELKAESDVEDQAFAKGFYGPGDLGSKLQALNDYGAYPLADDGQNLLFQLLLDPTNAIPLKATTYLARGKYAVAARPETRVKTLVKSPHAFLTVDEGTLNLRKEFSKFSEEIKAKGLTEEQALDMLRREIVGVKDADELHTAVDDFTQKLGIDPKKVSESQLFNFAEYLTKQAVRERKVPLLTQADELNKEAAERLSALQKSREAAQTAAKRAGQRVKARLGKRVEEGQKARESLSAQRLAQEEELVNRAKAKKKRENMDAYNEKRRAKRAADRAEREAAAKVKADGEAQLAKHDPNVSGVTDSAVGKKQTDTVVQQVRAAAASPSPVVPGKPRFYDAADEFYMNDPLGNRLPREFKPDAEYNALVKAAKAGDADAAEQLINRSRFERNRFRMEQEDLGLTMNRSSRRFRITKFDIAERAGTVGDDVATERLLRDRKTIRHLKRVTSANKQADEYVRGFVRGGDTEGKVNPMIEGGKGHEVAKYDSYTNAAGEETLDLRPQQVGDRLAIGEDILDAATSLRGVKDVYNTFSHDQLHFFTSKVFKDLQNPDFVKGMTTEQFGRYVAHMNPEDGSMPLGAASFRNNGMFLFEVFHQLRLAKDWDKLREFSDYMTAVLIDEPTDIWAWMWKTMEDRSVLPYAMHISDIRAGFYAAAEAWNLHPGLAFSTIPGGYYSPRAPYTFGLSARLEGLAENRSDLFVRAPNGYSKQAAKSEVTRIFLGGKGEPSRIVHYVAEFVGDFWKGGEIYVRMMDELTHAAALTMGPKALSDAVMRFGNDIHPELLKFSDRNETPVVELIDTLIDKNLRKWGRNAGQPRPTYRDIRKAIEKAYDQGHLAGIPPRGHTLMYLARLQSNPKSWLGHSYTYMRYMTAAGAGAEAKTLVSELFDTEILTDVSRLAGEGAGRPAFRDAISGVRVPASEYSRVAFWKEFGFTPSAARLKAYAETRVENADDLERQFDEAKTRDDWLQDDYSTPNADYTGTVDTSDFAANVRGLVDDIIKGDQVAVRRLEGTIRAFMSKLVDSGAASVDQTSLDEMADTLRGLAKESPSVARILRDLQKEMGFRRLGASLDSAVEPVAQEEARLLQLLRSMETPGGAIRPGAEARHAKVKEDLERLRPHKETLHSTRPKALGDATASYANEIADGDAIARAAFDDVIDVVRKTLLAAKKKVTIGGQTWDEIDPIAQWVAKDVNFPKVMAEVADLIADGKRVKFLASGAFAAVLDIGDDLVLRIGLDKGNYIDSKYVVQPTRTGSQGTLSWAVVPKATDSFKAKNLKGQDVVVKAGYEDRLEVAAQLKKEGYEVVDDGPDNFGYVKGQGYVVIDPGAVAKIGQKPEWKQPPPPKVEPRPEPPAASAPRAKAEQIYEAIFKMTEQEWYDFEKARINRVLTSKQYSKQAKSAARRRLRQIEAAEYAIKVERSRGTYVPWRERANFRDKVVKGYGADAEELFVGKAVAPFVQSAYDASVEQGRSLWRYLKSASSLKVPSSVKAISHKGEAVDHMPKGIWDELEERVADAISEARGWKADTRTAARQRRGMDLESSKPVGKRADNDPVVIAAKQKALDDFARETGWKVSIDAYDEARAVLRKPYLQHRTSLQLLARSEKIVARTGANLEETYIALRDKLAKREARLQLGGMAFGEYFGFPPEQVMAEFVARYGDDGTLKNFHPDLTAFQRRTLEENVKSISGLDKLDNRMGLFLQSANRPPLHSRDATREFLRRIGAWSPRTTLEFANGAKSWNIAEEARYWRDAYGEVPEWTDEALLAGEFNRIFHDEDLYFKQMNSWGVLSRSQELKLRVDGKTAEEIEKAVLEGDETLGLAARRELELQRKFVIERYGKLVSEDGVSLDAMPWLMYPDEVARYIAKQPAKSLPEGLIQSAKELEEVTQLIQKVMEPLLKKYIDPKVAVGEQVTYHDMFRVAAEIQAQLLANPKWARRYRDVVGDVLNRWAWFNRWLVFSNPAFLVTNAVDVPIKGAYYRFTRRSFFNAAVERVSPELRAKADSLTPVSLGLDATTAMYRVKQAGALTRLRNPRGYNVMEKALDRALAVVDGTGEVFPHIAGHAELRMKMELAKGMYPTIYQRALKQYGSDELADAFTKRFIKKEVSKMWPTAGDGPIEKLWNKFVPFASYSVRNKALFISEAFAHPAILNYIDHIGDYIEEENLKEWDKRHPGLEMPDHLRRRISLPWAPDYYLDLSTFSDAARGLKPIFEMATETKSALDWTSQWLRLVNPGVQAGVYSLFNAFNVMQKTGYIAILDKNGYPTGKYQRVTVPWTEPWSKDQPDLSSVFWFSEAMQTAASLGVNDWTAGEISQMAGQVFFFNGISTFDRGSVLNSTYYSLKDKNPEAAKQFLLTQNGEFLQDWWEDRAKDPREVIDAFRDLQKEIADPTPWFHDQSADFQKKVKDARALISEIRDSFSWKLEQLQPGTAEYRETKARMYWSINDVYLRTPELMAATVWGKSPREWGFALEEWETDKLMDDFMALSNQKPKREDFDSVVKYNDAVSEWEITKQTFLIQYPQVAQRLNEGRQDLDNVRRKMEAEWDKIFDRISTRNEQIEAAQKKGDRERLDQLYLANELDYSLLERDYAGTYFTEDDFNDLPREVQGPRSVKDGLLARAETILDFDRRRYEKAVREGKGAEFLADNKYQNALRDAVLKAKGGNQFGTFDPLKFVKAVKGNEYLKKEYYKRNPAKAQKWQRTDAYIKNIAVWGKLAGAGRWDEAQRVWDRMPDWVKQEYFKRNPDSKMRDFADGQKGSPYTYKGLFFKSAASRQRYIDGEAMFADGKPGSPHTYKGLYFKSAESRQRYIDGEKKFSEGRKGAAQTAQYLGYMTTWVKMFEKGDSDAAMEYFDSIPGWAKERYYQKHPENRLKFEDDAKRDKQLRDYFAGRTEDRAKYLKDNPEFGKFLADSGGKDAEYFAIQQAYRSIPKGEAWLRKVFRERYPEVFSQEAAGTRRLRRVYDTLAKHPDVLPEFEQWVKAIWDSYDTMLKSAGRPASWKVKGERKVPARAYKRSLSAAELREIEG